MAKKPKKKSKQAPPANNIADQDALLRAVAVGIRDAFDDSSVLQAAIRRGVEDGVSVFLQRTFSKGKG